MKRWAIPLLAVAFAAPAAARPARLRIGVFSLFHPTELVLEPEPHRALRLAAGEESLILTGSERVRCLAARGEVECRAGARAVSGRSVRAVGRGGAEADFTLAVPGRISRHYLGELEISATGRELIPVVEMDVEVAVASAVEAESPPGAPLAALEAQAVVTRSYYLGSRPRHRWFDFCDTTHCQFLRSPPAAGSPAARAALLTRGVVLLYRGAALPALFCASCGGRTRTLREVGLTPRGYPYYSVACPVCVRLARRWKVRLSLEQAAPLIAHPGWEDARLRLDRQLGWETVPGNNYTVEREGDAVILEGRGAGHGLGLCQMGAAGMARQGSSFARILAHYFPNTVLGNPPAQQLTAR